MAADHITWAKYWNNGAIESILITRASSGEFISIRVLLSMVGGVLVAIFTNRQSKPRKVLLFLGFCYNSLKK